MTRTAKVILGVGLGLGAVAGLTYVASNAWGRPKRSPPPFPHDPPDNGQIPPPNYAGSGWTGWPHKDVFPDMDALVQAFRRLGYDVTPSLISSKSMAEVGRFQADHNLWWALYDPAGIRPEDPAAPGEHLNPDELVGEDTVEGIYDAMLADQHFPGGWPALVAWYEDRA